MRPILSTAIVGAAALGAWFAPDVYDELRAVNAGQDAQLADHEARITALESGTPDPGGPVESGGEWYDFETDEAITPQTTKPAFRPDDQPDGDGVTFFIDGELNREDPTPNPYQIHPFGAHPAGTEFRAEWTDTGGVERYSGHTIGSVTPPDPDPPGPDPDPPTLDGRPSMTNVGCMDEAALTASGSRTLNNGAVLEGLYISGSVDVKGPGTIRNCVIDGGLYNVKANYGQHAVVIEDCTLRGSSSAAVLGYSVTMRRCVIHDHGGDGLKPYSGWLVEDCYITDLGSKEGAHADGVQFVSGGNSTFRRCNFDMPVPPPSPYKSNAAFFIATNNGPISNVVIEGCWMNGGNYTVYIIDKGNGHGVPTGCVVRNNRFGRDYRYGYWRNQSGSTVVEGNRWEDDGTLMDIND